MAAAAGLRKAVIDSGGMDADRGERWRSEAVYFPLCRFNLPEFVGSSDNPISALGAARRRLVVVALAAPANQLPDDFS